MALTISTRNALHDAASVDALRDDGALFTYSPDAILICTALHVREANPAAAALLGGTEPDSLRGRALGRLFVPPASHRLLLDALACGRTVTIPELKIRGISGGDFDAEVRVIPHRPGTSYVVIRDLTDRKRCERRLGEARARSDRLEHVKRTFLMNVSHEIRTPLTGILGSADILANETAGDPRELAVIVKRNGVRLMKTLTSILELAQLDLGEVRLSRNAIRVSEYVAEAVDDFKSEATRKDLMIHLDTSGSAEAMAAADADALRRILAHLLSNAVKFTERGGITVRMVTGDDTVSVQVEDSGIGIRDESLPHIFDAYTQESDGTGRDYEGIGLGLTISNRLAQLMGASLTVQSEWGRGATFTLTLPRSVPIRQTDIVDERRVRLSVLAVDDGEEMGAFLLQAIGREHDVDVVLDPAEARALAADRSYDLILFPVEAGGGPAAVGFVMELRALSKEDTTIAAVLPRGVTDDRAELLLAGFDGCIRRPLRVEEVEHLIHECQTCAA